MPPNYSKTLTKRNPEVFPFNEHISSIQTDSHYRMSATITPIFHHAGNFLNGNVSLVTGTYGYVLEPNTIVSRATPSSQFYNYDNYGKKNYLVRMPRLINIIFDAGWWFPEHNPMYLASTGYNTWDESIYFTPPNAGPGNLEKTIDYYTDLVNAVKTFAQPFKISVGVCYQSFGTYTNPLTSDAGIQITSSSFNPDFTSFIPINHIGRWLFHLVPRYYIFGVDSDLTFFTNQIGGQDLVLNSNEIDIKGGKVLNIIFATDAYSAYHGCSSRLFNTFLPDTSTIGNRACMLEDIDVIKRRSQYFEKWGCILVNSPKNPEFFPLWMQDSATTSNSEAPHAYALYDAQLHFSEVNTMLTGYNFDLLMRTTTLGTPPTPRHSIYESQSILFTRGQITVAEIMTKVEAFWAGE